MQRSHVDIIMYLFCLNENQCGKIKILQKNLKKKKIVIIKNNIAIRIAGKVSRYIDESCHPYYTPARGQLCVNTTVSVNIMFCLCIGCKMNTIHFPYEGSWMALRQGSLKTYINTTHSTCRVDEPSNSV